MLWHAGCREPRNNLHRALQNNSTFRWCPIQVLFRLEWGRRPPNSCALKKLFPEKAADDLRGIVPVLAVLRCMQGMGSPERS
jgi:hypothetical protein